MRALIAGPLTAVGGFHKKAAVFRPSIPVAAVEKLFGRGIGLRIAAMVESSVRPAVLFDALRMSYVRTQPIEVGVAHSGTFKAPVLGSTSKMEFRKIVWPPLMTGF